MFFVLDVPVFGGQCGIRVEKIAAGRRILVEIHHTEGSCWSSAHVFKLLIDFFDRFEEVAQKVLLPFLENLLALILR